MDNGFNGGMQDISSMNMGMQGKDPKQKKRGGYRIKSGMFLPAVIGAAVILFILIFFIAGMSGKGKVKSVLKEYLTNDLDEIKWDKWYPDEIADAIEDMMEEYGEDMMEGYGDEDSGPYDSVDILAVSKISIKEYDDLLENMVLNTANMFEADIDKRDIKITEAYMVFCNAEAGKKVEFVGPFVIKVNGKYGVYGYTNSENFEGASSGRKNFFGTYVLYEVGVNGYTFDAEDFEQSFGQKINVYLLIDSDGSFEMDLRDVGSDLVIGSWESSGDDLIFTSERESIMGAYQDGVITISMGGQYMSFKK